MAAIAVAALHEITLADLKPHLLSIIPFLVLAQLVQAYRTWIREQICPKFNCCRQIGYSVSSLSIFNQEIKDLLRTAKLQILWICVHKSAAGPVHRRQKLKGSDSRAQVFHDAYYSHPTAPSSPGGHISHGRMGARASAAPFHQVTMH